MFRTRASSPAGRMVDPTVTSVEQLPKWVNEVGLDWLYRLFAQSQQGQGFFEAARPSSLASQLKSPLHIKSSAPKQPHFSKRDYVRLSK